MQILLLHGAVGFWDEVACLVIPATAIMGIALAVLREKAPEDVAEAASAGEPPEASDDAPDGAQRSEG